MTTQRVDAYLIMSYPVGESVPKSALAGKQVISLSSAEGTLTVATTAAAAWGEVATIAPGKLAPGRYAVSKFICYSATGKAFRLTNVGFYNLKPGGPIGQTICHKKNVFDFGDFDECPVFDASTTLGIELLTVSAETPVVTIELVQL